VGHPYFPVDFVSARIQERSGVGGVGVDCAGQRSWIAGEQALGNSHSLPFWNCGRTLASKLFEIKILPATDCAPRSFFPFPSNSMIPTYRAGRGYPDMSRSPILGTPIRGFVSRSSQPPIEPQKHGSTQGWAILKPAPDSQLHNFQIPQLLNSHYSYLSATMGSTFVARRAGM
jgi:hypothetical protein